MSSKKSILGTAVLAGLALAATGCSSMKPEAKTSEVMCHGVNACKGHGSCAGKVDACSGKNGCESKLTCAGHNSCKGKGLVKMSKEDCLSKGGKVSS